MNDKIWIYSGESQIVKGNHSGMPKRDDSYLETDERGHIQASSLGGDNSRNNIVPQSKDVNHGGYSSMERGERYSLKHGNTIQSEKMALASNQPGNRPDVFIVNDTIVSPNGKEQNVHLSFSNINYKGQEEMDKISTEQAYELFDVYPNSVSPSRELITNEKYAEIMEGTDKYTPSIQDMYSDEWISLEYDLDENTDTNVVNDDVQVDNVEYSVNDDAQADNVEYSVNDGVQADNSGECSANDTVQVDFDM